MIADILHKVAGQFVQERGAFKPRPSLAGPDRCIRQLVYWANGTEPEKMPDRVQITFDDGHWHEELTADWIRKTAYQIHSGQMPVETAVGRGHIDGLLTDLTGVDRLWEHKSINHFGFELLKKEPPLDYLCQVALYLGGLLAEQPDIREAVLLFKNKNTGAYLELVLFYDAPKDLLTVESAFCTDGDKVEYVGQSFPGLVRGAVEKFAAVQSHVTAKTLPDRPFEFGTAFPCDYCSWQSKCWEGYANELESFSDDAALNAEVETLCRYYLEQSGHEKRAAEEKKKLKESIKACLTAIKAKKGRAGPYEVSLRLQAKKETVVKASTFEVLTIRKVKE